jgi:SNF2 family DNA or RNA helicase
LEQWENQRFEGKISIRFAGAWIELGDFLGAARKSDALLVMDGRYFSLQSLEGRLLQLLWHNVQKEGITPAVFFRTSSFFGSRLRLDVAEPLKEVLDEFQEMKPLDLPDLSPTGLQLRQYQEIGYAWMMFLHRVGAGGLLCDQMGLGKTHQAMALIAGMLRERPQAKILVVVPKGVFHHWVDKLDRFIPEVSVAHFIGADRDAEAALGHQVVLTTYGTLRNSRNAFFGVVFDALICDEIQALKNRHTLSHETLLQMDALSRFGLSGTPIENSLNDLKNLLDVVLPGYLGDDAFFQQGFVKPIEVDRNLEIAEMLRRLIHPFVLRRSKSEVLQELPEKVEDLLRIELSSEEHTRYQQVLREEWGSIGDGQTAMHLFQAINRLKQLCDHPALFYQKGSYDDYPCQKWDVFTEVLQEALEAEEKVVVFTQYLGMIELMKAFLEDKGIDYAWVTGQVRDRHKSIERFQSDDSCRVFLGSLGAAGVGIDLTAGSVLIHYDRWWNAAKEEQATDRLHRIGQKKTVQVFKLITANTIEDRIHQLIENKKQLLEDVVMFDDEAAVKRISMGELLDLLRP